MKVAVIVIVVVGVLLGGALNLHFIHLDDGIRVLKKESMTFEDTYVDARGAKMLKLLTKPALIKAGVRDLVEKRK